MKKVLIALRMAGVPGQGKLRGILRHRGSSRNWRMRIFRTVTEFNERSVKNAIARGYDGIILSIAATEGIQKLLAESSLKIVTMDFDYPLLDRIRPPSVRIQNSGREIGQVAAQRLMSSGRCRSYAVLHNPDGIRWSVERGREFRAELAANGFRCRELRNLSPLFRLPRPIGLLAANDDQGCDAIEFCATNGLRVPEDVEVIGINNDELICENCAPRLTSIEPDYEREGYLAAEALDRLLDASCQPSSRVKPPSTTVLTVGVKRIVERESTTGASHAGRLVQKALAFIDANACRGVSARDVAEHLKVSRRLVDLRFRELQGISIGETIIQRRLDEAKRLLASTTRPIAEIVELCGYHNPVQLSKLFRERLNQTMSDYRRQHDQNGVRLLRADMIYEPHPKR